MDMHPSFQKGIPKFMDKFRMNTGCQAVSRNNKNDQSTKLCNLVAKFRMFPMHPETRTRPEVDEGRDAPKRWEV